MGLSAGILKLIINYIIINGNDWDMTRAGMNFDVMKVLTLT